MRKSFTSQPALFATHDLLDHPALNALDGIESLINWSALEPLFPPGKGETGRSGYAALTLFGALLLGLWHDLSDVKLEAQLARDLMFRKFCRMALEKSGRLEAVLSKINTRLSSQNVILQEGRVAIVPYRRFRNRLPGNGRDRNRGRTERISQGRPRGGQPCKG